MRTTTWPAGPFLISTRPPSKRQKWTAAAIVVVWFAGFLVAIAFRGVQLARPDTFVPMANTVICLNDLITAVLLYAQFSLTRSRALLLLAAGYQFKALIMVPHALAFPGIFVSNSLLGASDQTTAWLYLFQHVGFLVGAIAYTKSRGRQIDAVADNEDVAAPIFWSVNAVIAGVVLVTWFVVAIDPHLPPLMDDALTVSAGWRHVGGPLFAASGLVSLVVLRKRSASMIDLWLKVAIWSWFLETLLIAMLQSRFSLLFYVSRTMSMLSSAFVLLVFLSESLMLQRRLVLSIVAREREREGHRTAMEVTVGSLAHELRQPLASIKTNGYAGALLMSSAPSHYGDVRDIFDDIGASVARADEIIDSVRTMFARGPGISAAIDMNQLAREAVEMMHMDLEAYRVTTEFDLAAALPKVEGHRGQLMQVVLNGLKNAFESLATVSVGARSLRIRTSALNERVSITIEDAGPGLHEAARERAFEPFYSTKARGMGLGLSICRSIVGAHGGTVVLLPGDKCGAIFRVELPASNVVEPSRTDVHLRRGRRRIAPCKSAGRADSPTSQLEWWNRSPKGDGADPLAGLWRAILPRLASR